MKVNLVSIKKSLGFSIALFFTTSLYAQDLEQIKKQKPFEIHGSVAASVGYYKASGFNTTRKPYAYSIMAAPTISLYGIQIPFNFTFVEGSNSIKNPFAQFGVNPSYKWAKLYLGWTNMSWSPTTLNGKTFLGVGAEINPSLFRFGAMYGRLNPAIKENLLGPNPQQPQFKRIGYAFKLGVGNDKNFVDLIYLKGKDVSSSIPAPADALNQLNYQPAENLVIGINSKQAMFKQKLIWLLDGSVSGYTRNTNSQALDLGNSKGAAILKAVLPIRLSTDLAWMVHSNLTYKAKAFTLGADYSRVQPGFQSMGLDYILNDQQRIILNQNITAKKGKVTLSFSQFYQHDNLGKRKAVKTNRTGLTASIGLNISQKFGMAIAYNNFIVFQQKGLKEVNDSTKTLMFQQNITLAPRYTIIKPKYVHNIFTAITFSRLDDLNKITAQYTQNNTLNTSVGYALAVVKSSWSFAPTMNVLYTKTPLFELINVGPSASVSKTWWKGKINTSVSGTYTASRQNKVWNAHTINNAVGIGYRVNSHHNLQLNNYITYSTSTFRSGKEYRGDVQYTYTF